MNKWKQGALELALRANANENFKIILASSGANDVYKGKILEIAKKQQNKEIIVYYLAYALLNCKKIFYAQNKRECLNTSPPVLTN